MRKPLRLVLCLLPLAGRLQAQAVPPPPPAASPASQDDPLLLDLVREALDRNPDLAQAKVLVQADREKIPQARALPDPTLSLGIQNDGFKKIQVGEMETSYYQVMVTQPLPWPGKRGLRGEIARLGAQSDEITLDRTRLGVTADVHRSYLGLLLVRGQLRLLEDQAALLREAEATARSRYEVGQGAQADLLRAQLERTRVDQARSRLRVEERDALAALNRLRGRPQDTAIPTTRSLDSLPDPPPVPPGLMARAEAESPELRAANLGIQQARKNLDLARLNRRPDLSVSAGVMPRGALEPMWTASVGITLPVWQKQKQKRAVAEQEYREQASNWDAERVRCLLDQRIQERTGELASALEILRLYRSGLLVQSESSFRATLAQYTVGKVPFLAVLESLNGWLADQSGLLQAEAQAQAVQIALDEWSLAATPAIGATGLSSVALGGAAQASAGSAAKGGAAPAAGDSGSSSMSTM